MNRRTILGSLPKSEARSGPAFATFPPDKTPYNMTASSADQPSVDLCNLVISFSSIAEYMATTADIANAQTHKLRETLKEAPPGRKDRRQMNDTSDLAGAMIGGSIEDYGKASPEEPRGSSIASIEAGSEGREASSGKGRSCRSSTGSRHLSARAPVLDKAVLSAFRLLQTSLPSCVQAAADLAHRAFRLLQTSLPLCFQAAADPAII